MLYFVEILLRKSQTCPNLQTHDSLKPELNKFARIMFLRSCGQGYRSVIFDGMLLGMNLGSLFNLGLENIYIQKLRSASKMVTVFCSNNAVYC